MSKENKETKFKIFLNKAKKLIPELAKVGGKLATGNYLGAISEVGEIITGDSYSLDGVEREQDIMRFTLPQLTVLIGTVFI